MGLTISKIAGFVYAVVLFVLLIVHHHGIGCVPVVIAMLLVLFPEELDDFYTSAGDKGVRVWHNSPPVLISFLGWLFLLGLPVFFYRMGWFK